MLWGTHHGTVVGRRADTNQFRPEWAHSVFSFFLQSPPFEMCSPGACMSVDALKAVRTVEEVSGHNACKDAAIANPLPPRLDRVLNRASLAGAGALWARLRI
jgi:hypothetical protein